MNPYRPCRPALLLLNLYLQPQPVHPASLPPQLRGLRLCGPVLHTPQSSRRPILALEAALSDLDHESKSPSIGKEVSFLPSLLASLSPPPQLLALLARVTFSWLKFGVVNSFSMAASLLWGH